MTNKQYIKHLISESCAIKAENQKLKDKVVEQDHTIYVLKDTIHTLRFNINKLKEKYSK